MIKQLAQFEHKVGEKVFHFLCEGNADVSHIKEALSTFMGRAVNIEENVKAQMAAQASASAESPAPAPVQASAAPVVETVPQG